MQNTSSISVIIKLVFLVMLVVGTAIYFMGRKGIADEIDHHGATVKSEAGYQECLGCHDGVSAPSISPCLEKFCMLKTDHVINISYPPTEKTREYTSAAAAEMAGIKFVNGRIDCISCHDLLNPKKFHLRIEDFQSRLCLACHIK